MGTLQNRVIRTFRMIAEACAGLDLQLVISLGGGQDPALRTSGLRYVGVKTGE